MNPTGYGSGQRQPTQQSYEAPACVQNAMMTKDKKPFTYTPGGIDLSQIKSERMAKRLARNAQAEGATGAAQMNRPTQPTSPGSSGNAASTMGAAAMGMPFQVLPPPPPPPPVPTSSATMGKNLNGASAPPPPPPPSSNTTTLAPPPTNGRGGPGSAPGTPNTARKSPTPQKFEPPPMGFRPEIKIPSNPMATLRKVPPPVEKNTFWKDEYVKDRSKSPMPNESDRGNSPNNVASYGEPNDYSNNNNNNNSSVDGYKKPIQTTAPPTIPQQSETNNSYNNQQYTPTQQTQQQQNNVSTLATPQQQSTRPEFRSVTAPQSPAVNVYTRQTDSPRANMTGTPPQQTTTDSPFRFAQQTQQQLQQQRTPPAVSPLAQQYQQQQPMYTPISSNSPQVPTPPPTQSPHQTQASAVPWRTQRNQAPQQQQQQTHPQPIYNNVAMQQQQRAREGISPAREQTTYANQGPKPTNIGSLYIAPLTQPVEPQAQNIVRQQLQQQQQQQRDSPMRQLPQQQQPTIRQPARWMSTQPAPKEQPEWARPEENGNVVPSSLQRLKSPPPVGVNQMQQQAPQQQQQQQYQYQPQMQSVPASSFGAHNGQNFSAPTAQPATTGLRLQINNQSGSGPKERIIPIQLESTPTPTYTPAQPNFNVNAGMGGANVAPTGYVIRSPNQFVDQGYNNYPMTGEQQMRGPSMQRVMSPTQQLNAPRIIQQQQQQQQLQQTQQQQQSGNKTRIVPIAIESGEGTRGPISPTPIVIQNDQRTPPIQSKSFRILQKITDTIDDGSSDGNLSSKNESFADAEPPQLQRPQFARQMSAQQAHNSPTIEQMRRMQISNEQQQQQQQQPQQQQQQQHNWNQQGNSTATPNKFMQQRNAFNNTSNDITQQYVHPSEQHVPEPKKYTGSAIPSRSFKILQAMTTPENAGPGQSDL